MDRAFARDQAASVLGAYAASMGVDLSAFATGGLTVVDRPAGSPWPYLMLAVTTPGGTVVAVDPVFRPTAALGMPKKHYRLTRAEYMARLRALAAGIRPAAAIDGPDLAWALASPPAEPAFPAGLRVEIRDQSWMNSEQANGRFENGVGNLGRARRDERNRYALVVIDSEGDPVAVAGMFDSLGLAEIGVDVVASRQGEGLGSAVVAAAVREILRRGDIPFYACAADNIRSQRTALSVGFVQLFSEASIS